MEIIMNVEKFNKDATKLIKKYKGAVQFVTEETIEKNKEPMRECSDDIIKVVQKVFNICLTQNISAIDNASFGNFVIDMTKLYWNAFAIAPSVQSAVQPIGETNEHSN